MTPESNQSAGDGIYIGSLFDFLDEQPDTGVERRLDELLEKLKQKKKSIRSRWKKKNRFYFETLFINYDWIADDIYGEPVLSAHEERSLFENYFSSKDINLRNTIVCCYLKLVMSNVRHFSFPILDYEDFIGLDDLFQEGVLGLIEAVDRFDVNTGNRFATYAHWWIRQKIHAALSEVTVVRVPINRQDLDAKAKGKMQKFEQVLGRFATAREFAQYMDMKEEDAVRILFKYDLESSHIEVVDFSEDKINEFTDGTWQFGDSFDLFTETHRKQELLNILHEILDNREIEIVKAYYGFLGDDGRTLEDIGTSLKLTRERVRQILKKALGKLERHLSRNPLLNIPN